MIGANLTNARLNSAYVGNVNFADANLKGASLINAVIAGANFTGSDITNTNFNGVSCITGVGNAEAYITPDGAKTFALCK
ncbi:Genome sequencing data, contig C306 (fragment) [Microcystis aeruginosa PCC 7941]